MTEAEIEILVNRAAKRAVEEALHGVGLNDEQAMKDVTELRGLLDSWRATKDTINRTIAQIVTTAILSAIATGIWFKWGGK